MGEVRSGASTARLRPPPPFAAPPARVHRTPRCCGCTATCGPTCPGWVTMLVVALLGTGATIVVPLVTKAVIDGPIADRDERGLFTLGAFAVALGVVEAVLMFVRRWVVARATLGVETAIRMDLYAHLQRLPMGFHGQWQSGQLLSRVMSDLSTVRRFLGFGLLFIVVNVLQIGVVTAILLQHVLAARPGRARRLGARGAAGAAQRARCSPGSRGRCRTRPATWPPRSRRAPTACGSSRRSAGPTTSSPGSTSAALRLQATSMEKVRVSARFWTVPRGHPERRPDHRARLRRDRRRPGPADPGHAGRVHHADALAGVAGRLARVPAVDDPGGDDRGRPDRRGARHRARRRPTATSSWSGRAGRCGSTASGSASPTAEHDVLHDVDLDVARGRDRGGRRRHRLGQDRPDQPGAAPVRRHGRARSPSTGSTSAT